MAHQHHSDETTNATNGNFVALVLVLGLVVIGAVILTGAFGGPGTAEPAERPIVTLVGRNLSWTASPTTTLTPSATWTLLPTRTLSPTPSPPPTATPTAPPAAGMGSPQQVAHGENIFQTTCSACHGFSAQGVPGLGPSMFDNPFVNGQSNESLQQFIMTGRPADHPDNKSGIPMPARGGNMSLVDEDILDVVYYIRSLNPDVPVVGAGGEVIAQPRETPTPRGTVVALGFTPLVLEGVVPVDEDPAVDPSNPDPFFTAAQQRYELNCAGCHGSDGEGVAAIARPLTGSELLAIGNGIGLLQLFLDPDPGQGFAHPFRGGVLEMSDEEILQVIGYLYTLPGIRELNTRIDT
jgi:mono/diheme cytochrome c family protein